MRRKELKDKIVGLAEIYGHREFAKAKPLQPGRDYIPVSGAMRSGKEIRNGVEAALDGWWTEGRWVAKFEEGLRSQFGKQVVMVNSGSSANLLALAALKEVRDLPEGGEIITTALAFPTTVNPILQLGFKPHFIDIQLGSYVPNINDIELAINDKTVAIMIAHTLGNPWPVTSFHDYPTIEDNCDALGSDIQGMTFTGCVGDFSTLSFYPAHHITTGEGGAVVCGKKMYEKVVRSFRDWGRDCWCPTGQEGTCGKRFDWKFPGLPDGYDHKYIYSRIGWNMKPTEMQASIGVAQLERVSEFIGVRRANFTYLKQRFLDKQLSNYFILPQEVEYGHASWFGFPLTLKSRANFTVTELMHKLEYDYKIGTRRIFAGNILAHPAYAGIEYEATDLTNTVIAAERSFWIGVWPRITPVIIDYMVESIAESVESLGGQK